MRVGDVDRRRIQIADLHRLQLLPAVAQARKVLGGERPISDWMRAPFICNLFEAISWLGIGTQCGYFDPQDARRLLLTHSDVIKSSFELYRTRNMSGFTPALEPSLFRIILDGDLGHGRMDSPDSEALFRFALLMSRRLTVDSLADVACLLLTFLDKQDWDRLVDQRPTATSVLEVLSNPLAGVDQIRVTDAILAAGFIRILEHMARSQAFFNSIRNVQPGGLVSLLGMPQSWRLKLRDPDIEARFNLLTNTIPRIMVEEFPISPSEARAPVAPVGPTEPTAAWANFSEGFAACAQGLMKSWIRDHVLWREAAAD